MKGKPFAESNLLCLTECLTLKLWLVGWLVNWLYLDSGITARLKSQNICTGYDFQLRSVGDELHWKYIQKYMHMDIYTPEICFSFISGVVQLEHSTRIVVEHMLCMDMFIKCRWTMDFYRYIFAKKRHPLGIIFSFQLIFFCRLTRVTHTHANSTTLLMSSLIVA